MARHQLTERKATRYLAGRLAGSDPRQANVFAVQAAGRDGLMAICRMIGGGLEDSALLEIVNPATGHFWHQDGISAAGGTDDARP